MNRSIWLAALCFATTPAYAGDLVEIEAASIDLSGFRGVSTIAAKAMAIAS